MFRVSFSDGTFPFVLIASISKRAQPRDHLDAFSDHHI